MAKIAKSRAMRKALTPPEARLWLALRPLRAQGHHFRRQHPFHGYFLDFVCLSRGLVVEVDGTSHEHRAEWDARRDAALLAHGLRTLRIPAIDVRDHLTEVMEMIVRELDTAPTRSLLPVPGRETERLPSLPPPAGEGRPRSGRVGAAPYPLFASKSARAASMRSTFASAQVHTPQKASASVRPRSVRRYSTLGGITG
jgi:very-short-patch-repair endonuclease